MWLIVSVVILFISGNCRSVALNACADAEAVGCIKSVKLNGPAVACGCNGCYRITVFCYLGVVICELYSDRLRADAVFVVFIVPDNSGLVALMDVPERVTLPL